MLDGDILSGIAIAISYLNLLINTRNTVIPGSLSTINVPSEVTKVDGAQLETEYNSLNNNEISDGIDSDFALALEAVAAESSAEVADLELPLEGLQAEPSLPPEALQDIQLSVEEAEILVSVLNAPGLSQQLTVEPSQLARVNEYLQNVINLGTSNTANLNATEFRNLNLVDLRNLSQQLSELDLSELNANRLSTANANRFERIDLTDVANQLNQLFEGQRSGRESDVLSLVNNHRALSNQLTVTDAQPRLDSNIINNVSNNLNQLVNSNNSLKPNVATTVTVPTALSNPQFQEAFNSRVVLLAQGQNQVANIQINPAELGPVEIRLNINADSTHIQFISQHSQVREAIEDAFPKLRDMMSESGVNLGDVNVSDQRSNQQAFSDPELATETGSYVFNETDNPVEDTPVSQTQIISNGLVDHYV